LSCRAELDTILDFLQTHRGEEMEDNAIIDALEKEVLRLLTMELKAA
jgi:hypothetical protein